MFYIPDYHDKWAEHSRQQEEMANRLPKCCDCGETIQDDYCFVINGEILCERCLKDNYRKATEDLTQE